MTVDESVSNLTSASNNEASISSGNKDDQPAPKKRRNLPGNPEPGAEVIALSPRSLLATNRFLCDSCGKGFQRDQNLQLHRRGHNLPWKLKQRNKNEDARRKVYVCPEVNCVHHDPSRALGDLTGIKKHFCRKHGEKKWRCEKCSKRYAVLSDWKAHSKICGTREYRCDCGTLFSRRDSFITHRAFCEALAEENARAIITSYPTPPPPKTTTLTANNHQLNLFQNQFHGGLNIPSSSPPMFPVIKREEHQEYQSVNQYPINNEFPSNFLINSTSLDDHHHHQPSYSSSSNPNYNNNSNPFMPPHMSATALMQKAMNINNNKSKDPMLDIGIRRRPHQVHMTKTTTTNLAASAGLSSRADNNQEQEEMMMMMGNKFIHGDSKYYMQQQQVPVNYYHDHDHHSGDMMIMPAAAAIAGGGGFNDDGIFNGIFNSSSSSNGNTAMVMMRNLDGGMQNPRPSSYYYKDHIGGGNGGNEGLTRDFLGLTVPFPSNREQCDNFFMGDIDHKQIGSSTYQNL